MATKRKASWLSKKVQDNVPFQAHRRMDLRNIEEYSNFRATKCVFSMTGDQKFSITAHKNTPEVLKEEMIMELDRLIASGEYGSCSRFRLSSELYHTFLFALRGFRS